MGLLDCHSLLEALGKQLDVRLAAHGHVVSHRAVVDGAVDSSLLLECALELVGGFGAAFPAEHSEVMGWATAGPLQQKAVWRVVVQENQYSEYS